MDLTRVILGPVVTEKAERLKIGQKRTYTLRISPHATKVDVQHALERFYDVEVEKIRIIPVRSKHRLFGRGASMEKRHAGKKALVTLTSKSRVLDITSFKTL